MKTVFKVHHYSLIYVLATHTVFRFSLPRVCEPIGTGDAKITNKQPSPLGSSQSSRIDRNAS